jgi:hypothetical protein
MVGADPDPLLVNIWPAVPVAADAIVVELFAYMTPFVVNPEKEGVAACQVGSALAPFEVSTCPDVPIPTTFWKGPVAVVPAVITE